MAHHFLWPVGQAVKTPPFHGGNTGSNPVRVIQANRLLLQKPIFSYLDNFLRNVGGNTRGKGNKGESVEEFFEIVTFF